MSYVLSDIPPALLAPVYLSGVIQCYAHYSKTCSWALPVRENRQHLSFWSWVTTLSITFSRPIYFPSNFSFILVYWKQFHGTYFSIRWWTARLTPLPRLWTEPQGTCICRHLWSRAMEICPGVEEHVAVLAFQGAIKLISTVVLPVLFWFCDRVPTYNPGWNGTRPASALYPPKCWNYSCAPTHPASNDLFP